MEQFFSSSLSYLLNHEILTGARLPIEGRSHKLGSIYNVYICFFFKLGLDVSSKNGKGERKKYVKIRWL